MTLFAVVAQGEFYAAQQEKRQHVYKRTGLFFGFLYLLGFWIYQIQWSGLEHYFPVYRGLVIVTFVLALLGRPVLSRHMDATPTATIAFTLMGFFYVPYLFSYVAFITFDLGTASQARWLLLYLLAVTKFTDLGAYVVGSIMGRHKMIPEISPKKTWEGFLGGILMALGMSVLITYRCPNGLAAIKGVHAVILGILIPLASVVGDLTESVFKRDAHIKDSGHTIPGIGGSLDLIDSLLFTAPVLYFYVAFIIKHL